jgi:hypothetical protein
MPWQVTVTGACLLAGGPGGWLLGYVAFPSGPEALLRLFVGQLAAAAGLLAGWRAGLSAIRADSRAAGTDRWEPLARLGRQRLYLDQVTQHFFQGPAALFRFVIHWLGPATIDRVWTGMILRSAAWLGTQVESLHEERVDFQVAAFVLGTVTLLLTLILVT